MVELPRDKKRLKAIQDNPATYAATVLKTLTKTYPDAKCALDFSTPLELLVATILSAQCTDKAINLITPALFKKYKTARAYANADLKTFEQEIKKSGFYRAKSKSIMSATKIIDEKFKGKVPSRMEELITLPGVGRKTANCVLGNAYNKQEGVVVDTHVLRLSYRFGLTNQRDPVKIEKDLMAIIPRKEWTHAAHVITFHGRNICKALRPMCDVCPLKTSCPSSSAT